MFSLIGHFIWVQLLLTQIISQSHVRKSVHLGMMVKTTEIQAEHQNGMLVGSRQADLSI